VINVEKQVIYWRESATEDLRAARALMEKEHTRHALFFAHLALEKLLKAHVVRATKDLAPKTHLLPRLAELANFSLPQDQASFIKRFDRYHIMGRYPEFPAQRMDAERARETMQKAEEVFQWLTDQF
jgi:HEPN domain-containing protein